ncbi:phosphoenolpyruvate carboxykinase domain-containing protein [Nocardia sp. CC227C]|uniref:phosphoenolpyruvate carboxykinase domain-containing protein n=1 Tax=Nocardia sp. CC227C TaxID=3044562 RepID=UPI00278BD903|nr:phosphoenolpyruvate carboxykinase domain-containing protein [Nocardia sp. CC227C]
MPRLPRGRLLAPRLSLAQRDRARLPNIFRVTWFRRSGEGAFRRSGFGDNVRVPQWAFARVSGCRP